MEKSLAFHGGDLDDTIKAVWWIWSSISMEERGNDTIITNCYLYSAYAGDDGDDNYHCKCRLCSCQMATMAMI